MRVISSGRVLPLKLHYLYQVHKMSSVKEQLIENLTEDSAVFPLAF